MDAHHFDSLTCTLTAAGSRRRVLGATLAGMLGTLWRDTTVAKKKACPPCKRRKKGKCKPKPAGTPCTALLGGACHNGTCIDLKADEANCGSLGTVCGPTEVCQNGTCFPRSTCPAPTPRICSPGRTACGGHPSCSCDTSTEGNVVCVTTNYVTCTSSVCTTSADCAAGSACVDLSGGGCLCGPGTKVCMPRCPA